MDPAPGHAGADPVMVGTDAPVVEDMLLEIAVRWPDRPRQHQDVGWEILLQVFLGTVPGAIGTDDDVGHDPPPFA